MSQEELNRIAKAIEATNAEDRNVMLWELYRTSDSDGPIYTCVECGNVTKGSDSCSYKGRMRTCSPCIIKKYGSIGEYFNKAYEIYGRPEDQ